MRHPLKVTSQLTLGSASPPRWGRRRKGVIYKAGRTIVRIYDDDATDAHGIDTEAPRGCNSQNQPPEPAVSAGVWQGLTHIDTEGCGVACES